MPMMRTPKANRLHWRTQMQFALGIPQFKTLGSGCVCRTQEGGNLDWTREAGNAHRAWNNLNGGNKRDHDRIAHFIISSLKSIGYPATHVVKKRYIQYPIKEVKGTTQGSVTDGVFQAEDGTIYTVYL